jgi:hypothetical protein
VMSTLDFISEWNEESVFGTAYRQFCSIAIGSDLSIFQPIWK